MNVNDGSIRMLGEDEAPTAEEIRLEMAELTEKQRAEMSVSLHDHRSSAGKKLTEERQKRGLTKPLPEAEKKGFVEVSDDINKVLLVGRLTRDAELMYTNSGYALSKFSLAVNRRKKQGDQYVDDASFFDINLWGKSAENLNQYLLKGTQLAVEGQLRQERWEQDGMKRSKVSIEAIKVQLLGGRQEGQGHSSGYSQGSQQRPQQSGGPQSFESYTPPSGPIQDDYEDDIPF